MISINYSPYCCSAVARCLPGLHLLSAVLQGIHTRSHAQMHKNRATLINGTPDVAGESNRNVQDAITCTNSAFLKFRHDSLKQKAKLEKSKVYGIPVMNSKLHWASPSSIPSKINETSRNYSITSSNKKISSSITFSNKETSLLSVRFT